MVWWTQLKKKKSTDRDLGNIPVSKKLWNVNSSSWFETITKVKILKLLWDGNFLSQCILVLILIYLGTFREMNFFFQFIKRWEGSTHQERKQITATSCAWKSSEVSSFHTDFYYVLSFLPFKQGNEAQTFHTEIFWVSNCWSVVRAWTAHCYHKKMSEAAPVNSLTI